MEHWVVTNTNCAQQTPIPSFICPPVTNLPVRVPALMLSPSTISASMLVPVLTPLAKRHMYRRSDIQMNSSSDAVPGLQTRLDMRGIGISHAEAARALAVGVVPAALALL